MNTVTINGVDIGVGHPVYITFEAGPTHAGVDSAIELIDHAADAGANAIKFQILDPDRLVSDRAQPFEYDILVDRDTGETATVAEPLYDLLKRRSLDFDQWRTVKAHADKRGLAFFATVGFEDEIDLVQELKCDSIKIASADINYHPLIRKAARTGLCIQLDTGNASLGEVEQAVDVCLAEGNDRVIIHQCPSGYPARLESIQLRMIPTIHNMFGVPAAFSDHTPGWEMDIAAVALGATLLEKTITMDRTTRSVEHMMSIEPDQMKQFIQSVRDVELAMGGSRRVLSDQQKQARNRVRRSAFYRQDLSAGHCLTAEDIEYRRPGTGVAPDRAESLLGYRIRGPVKAGTAMALSDLEAPSAH